MNRTMELNKLLKEKRLCCTVNPCIKCTGCGRGLCIDCNKLAPIGIGYCAVAREDHIWYDPRLMIPG